MSIGKIDWRPGGPALRRFGRSVLIGSLLIATLLWFGKGWRTAATVLAISGGGIGLLGLTGLRIALPGYWLWMGIAFVMGNIVSRLALAVVYYLVLTPIGLVGRLAGRDRLALRPTARESHWVDIDDRRGSDDARRQF